MVDKAKLLDMEQLVIAEYCELNGVEEQDIGANVMLMLCDVAYERVIEGWAAHMDYERELKRELGL
jgi:hypothetical protein